MDASWVGLFGVGTAGKREAACACQLGVWVLCFATRVTDVCCCCASGDHGLDVHGESSQEMPVVSRVAMDMASLDKASGVMTYLGWHHTGCLIVGSWLHDLR
jgi:hypothetical protein